MATRTAAQALGRVEDQTCGVQDHPVAHPGRKRRLLALLQHRLAFDVALVLDVQRVLAGQSGAAAGIGEVRIGTGVRVGALLERLVIRLVRGDQRAVQLPAGVVAGDR